MAYIKRTATLALFLLLLTTMGFFAASVVKYQGDLTKLNDDIRTKRVEINSLNNQIEDVKLNLTKLSDSLSLQIVREQDLSNQYLNVKGAKESLESKNTVLQKNLADLNLRFLSLEMNFTNLSDDYDNVLDDADDICDYSATANITECSDYR